MNTKLGIGILGLSALLFVGCAKQQVIMPTPTSIVVTATPTPAESVLPSSLPSAVQKEKGISMQKAVIHTSKGDITVELYPEEAPKTVKNFTEKATNSYYKNLTFHRVETWVIQGGDPLGNGTGGGKMPTELSKRAFEMGSLGVARGGDITVSNDSQFFICTEDCSWLTGQYTNFGKVTEGMDVVKKVAVGDKILSMSVLE